MKKFILSILMVLAYANVWALDIYYDEPVFKTGEKARYNLYYNWGFVWIHAGDCSFKVQEQKHNGENLLSLLVSGTTTSTFDKMYCIRDTFESYMNPKTFAPVYYRETKREDSYYSHTTYKYIAKENGDYCVLMDRTKRKKHDTKVIDLSNFTYDLIYSCYRFRNLNTDYLVYNKTVGFNMLFDDDIYSLGLTYKGKTQVTLKNGKKYNALKFVPKLITGDLFKKEDDMVIYVSDDQNHVPLMIEAKIKVGYVKAMLDDYKNNKYPLTSYIKKK